MITGGAGFIGLNLSQHIAARSNPSDEIILVDTTERHGQNAELVHLLSSPKVHLIQADLTLPSSLNRIPTPVDRVYHLAARVGVGPVCAAPAEVLRTNTLSTLNVFDWFANHSSPGAGLLFTSTSEVYGGAALSGFEIPVPTPEAVPLVISDLDNPRFSYAVAKMWGEAYAKHLSVSANVRIVNVRYHNVYGPAMGYDHVIPQVICRIRAREEPFRMIGADQTRSFCWVGDAVKATVRVMESDRVAPGEVVHIGNQQEEIKIGRLYDMLFDFSGWRPEKRQEHPADLGSVSRRCPDISKLRTLTGYEPSTTLCEGLKATMKWYLQHSK